MAYNDKVTQVRIEKSLDIKMKEMGLKLGKSKADCYRQALQEFIQKETEQELLRDSKIDEIVTKQLLETKENLLDEVNKSTDRLASILSNQNKILSVIYATDIFHLQRTVESRGLDIKDKYTESKLMEMMEEREDIVHKRLMKKARDNKAKKTASMEA